MSENGNAEQTGAGRNLVENGDETKIPAEAAAMVTALQASFTRSGPSYHPIFDKFGPEHTTQFLAQTHEQDMGELRIQTSNRWFRLAYVLIGVAVFVFLTFLLLPDHADLYFEILMGLGIFAAGIAGGYGIKAYQDRNRD